MSSIFADQKSKTLVAALVLAVCTITVYLPVANNDFINFDDPTYVTSNEIVQQGITARGAVWAFKTVGEAANYHPLTWLSHMVDCQLYGLNSTGHHFMSLLIHALNVVMLFLLLVRMTGAFWRSAIVAAIFALHPLNVESVAWISERKNVLSTSFWLLTTLAYLSFVRRRGLARYALVVLFFALGLLAKPMLVTLPFVLLLMDFWPLKRVDLIARADEALPSSAAAGPSGSRVAFLPLVAEKFPLLILSAASCVVTVIAQQDYGAMAGMKLISLQSRVANTALAYVTYISQMFWPAKLAIIYPHPLNAVSLGKAAAALLALVAVTAFAGLLIKRHRYLLIGWLWFLGTMVPVIGLVQVGAQSHADRYMYVPMIGLLIALVWGAAEIVGRSRVGRNALAAAAIIAAIAFSVVTRRQIAHWYTSLSVFEHALAVTKNNHVAHTNLGIAYLDIGGNGVALEHFREAVEIQPDFPEAQYNTALLLTNLGKTEEAIPHYYHALRLVKRPQLYANILNNLGVVMATRGENEKAQNLYHQALGADPLSIDVNTNLGILMQNQGRLQEARVQYNKTLQIKPGPVVYLKLGQVLRDQGDRQGAEQSYRAALDMSPEFADARIELDALLAQNSHTHPDR